jgi:hypothetical protein
MSLRAEAACMRAEAACIRARRLNYIVIQAARLVRMHAECSSRSIGAHAGCLGAHAARLFYSAHAGCFGRRARIYGALALALPRIQLQAASVTWRIYACMQAARAPASAGWLHASVRMQAALASTCIPACAPIEAACACMRAAAGCIHARRSS